MKKEMYFLRGLPGSGKSELAETLHKVFQAAEFSSIIVCADDYFIDDCGNYVFNISNIHAAHTQSQSLAKAAATIGVDNIIVSNTSTTEKELKPYLEIANNYGYKVTSLIVENRHGNSNVHNVPEKTLDKMKNRFSTKLI